MRQARQSPNNAESDASETGQDPGSAGESLASDKKRIWLWGRLNVQSKLLTMLLSVSIVAILVAGVVGYQFGSKALEAEAVEHLVTARDARARAVEELFQGLQRSLSTYSAGDSTRTAMAEFDSAFRELGSTPVPPADRQAVRQLYTDRFVPNVHEKSGKQVTVENVMPSSPAQIHLQSRYLANTPASPEQRANIEDAGDGSAWTAANRKHNKFFRTLMREQGYKDVMLVNTDGNVVYTANKGVELGANFFGPLYNDTLLSRGIQDVLRSNSTDEVKLTDFEEYLPAGNAPNGFGITPISVDGKVAGVMVIQLPVDRINAAMTAKQNWTGTGLGKTGEVFLVGEDRTMRSTSRQLVENPKAYRKAANDNGVSPEIVDEIVNQHSPIQRQPITSESAARGLQGETGTTTETNYLGHTVLTNYAPLDVRGLNWVVVGQIDRSEALAPVHRFVRNLTLVGLFLVLLVTLTSLVMARAFTQPLARLLGGVRKITAGDLDTRVEVRSRDEFGDLTTAFNDMGDRLRGKQDQLDEQGNENDRLLSYLMPAPVAQRYRKGEENIVSEHQDVCVMAATVNGFSDLAANTTTSEQGSMLNELVRTIESAAESSGVELAHTLQSNYIATCGLVVPRIDHTLRMLDFAAELEDLVARFSAQHNGSLTLRAGIDTGPAMSGVVGNRAAYDVWGESLDLAQTAQYTSDEPGIYVTQRVYEVVRDNYEFSEAGQTDGEQSQTIWALVRGEASQGDRP